MSKPRKVAPEPEPEPSWPERLEAIRKALGDVSPTEAAAAIGASERAWFYWVKGGSTPSPAYQRLIAQVEKRLKIRK